MRKQLFALGIVGSLACSSALLTAEPVTGSAKKTLAAPAIKVPTVSSKKPYRHPIGAMPDSAREFYTLSSGVDQLSVKLAESGQLVRFNYRVVDAAKAAVLNDRASSPSLLDEKAHAVLQVPTMEKVGPLRQSMPPEVGKTYWMVFSNKGNLVKAGHRVSVVIGPFRVDGLIVQ
jgi:hypothetical protein